MRRIFAGDVQGCADELDELVARATRAFGRDYELWLVGDLVNRGPASRRVLERVRGLADAGRARVVLGNHEIALLRTAWGQRALAPDDTFQDLLAARDADTWLDWIRSWPLVESGELGEQRFAMVHAAVAPEWGLDALAARARAVERRLARSRRSAAELLAADPRDDEDADALARVTRCRAVDARGRWSSDPPEHDTDAWHRRWAERGHDYAVVYGHWAMQGLHVASMLRGLDSGCVYHGAGRDGFLSAWLPAPDDPAPFGVPDERFWRIPARARYWRGAAG
jgi:bis(5'-nucleosyl)-tetraphosphatase (symmetrical)